MELRLYWSILSKRLWLIAFLVLAVLASYWLFRPASNPTYTASMRFVVGIQPEPRSEEYYTYDRYYTWLTAEYLLDDLAEVVKSRAFANDVASVAEIDVPVGAIQGMTSAGKLHRILTVTLTWPNPDQLTFLANAVADVLRYNGELYFAQLSTEDTVISLIDPPTVAQVGPSLRERLDLPLRLILALVAGVGLAFLLDYLDTRIRSRAQLEALGVPVLAEIPPRRSWPFGWGRRRITR